MQILTWYGNITYITGPVTCWLPMCFRRRYQCTQRRTTPSLYPLFYPGFWATLTVSHQKKKVSLKITKIFGKDTLTINSWQLKLPVDQLMTIRWSPLHHSPSRLIKYLTWVNVTRILRMSTRLKRHCLLQIKWILKPGNQLN